MEEVSQFGMLEAKDAEKGEKVGELGVKEKILATKEEKLLNRKKYQKDRHYCLIGEEGYSSPEKEATR
jgi:hypothetical protein